MKKLLTSFYFLLCSVMAMAIGPLPKARPVVQSDGTTVTVTAHGDGRVAFFTTSDGKIVVKDNRDNFYYAVISNGELTASPFLAHDPQIRGEAEIRFLEEHPVEEQLTRLNVLAHQRNPLHRAPSKTIVASTQDGLGKYNVPSEGSVTSLGKPAIPVIMVEFSDAKFAETTTQEKMTRFYNTPGYQEEAYCVGSVKDYFVSQSRGMFEPTFTVVGKVSLTKSYKDYGANNSYGFDTDVEGLVRDAVAAAVAQGVDFTPFKDKQGAVQLVSILYAGRGEATEPHTTANANLIWPCEVDINEEMSGVYFNSFFVGNELFEDGTLMGMGVFCHEFCHALGLPDFYCTDYNYRKDDPFGYWSIMDAGAYVNDGRSPIGYTAYERSYLGWLDIKEITGAQTVTLYPASMKDKDMAVLIRNPKDSKEYFILENRNPDTWYPHTDKEGHVFGQGLMVSHFVYDPVEWMRNVLNNVQDLKRAHIITADQSKLISSAAQENLFGNGVDHLDSLPLYGQQWLDAPFYRVVKNQDGSVTFNFMEVNGKPVPYQVGDVVDAGDLTLQYLGKKQWTVLPKREGAYSGHVVLPATFERDEKTYKVTAVSAGAFASCPDLLKVSIPASVDSIAPGAFRHSAKLSAIEVDEDNATYQSIDGALFTRSDAYGMDDVSSVEGQVTFDFNANPWGLPVSSNFSGQNNAGNIKAPIVQEGVTLEFENGSLPARLWKGASDVTLRTYQGGKLTFSVPDGCKIKHMEFTAPKFYLSAQEGTLVGNAWTGDAQAVTFLTTAPTQISKVVLTVTGLLTSESAILYYPAALTGSYALPQVVTRVGDFAFEGTALNEVKLSKAIARLGESSLSSTSLKRIVSPVATPPVASADPFAHTSETLCEIVLPNGGVEAYKADTYWGKFFNITNGVSSVMVQPESSPYFYDLQGRRVVRPTGGIYIYKGKLIAK